MARLSSRRRELADRWHSLAIHLLRRVRRRDAESGIGPAQLSALSVAVFDGPLTLGELARAEQVRPPTITRVVADLERAGLIERETDADDRRVIRVRATARGRAALRKGRERRIAELAAVLAGLTESERGVLERAAGVLEARLGRRHDAARRP